ncbi:MAG: hypothetical protein KIT09_28185 [Bryobacteraceae bacterium]|nr:hypothetical protein [Bryobacteraceae bacterium]
MPRPNILVVPNDDGYGPSALTSYLVKAILAERPDCRITVWNDFAFEFNRQLYTREIEQGTLEVSRVWNLVQLARPTGDISIEATLRLMGSYREASDAYGSAAAGRMFDLVIDFGAPAAARWAACQGKLSVSVFDHCWSKTLRMILADQPDVPATAAKKWERLASEIQEDEEHSRRVFLFPEIIAPRIFADYWAERIGGGAVQRFSGVFNEPRRWRRAEAREFLGFTEPGAALLVQGGGSAVWDEPLRRLLAQLDDAGDRVLKRSDVNLALWLPGRLAEAPEAAVLDRRQRARRLRPVPGGTIQSILPAIDYLALRAGGGSVNDAVAHRKPFICVREPAQSQIEAILAECERGAVTWGVEMARFREDPLGVLIEQQERLKAERAALRRRMREIPAHGERDLARQILTMLG